MLLIIYNIHLYDNRNSFQLRAIKPNTEYYHKGFTISGANIWNNLPNDIQES